MAGHHHIHCKACQGSNCVGPPFHVSVGHVPDPIPAQNHAPAKQQAPLWKVDHDLVRGLRRTRPEHHDFLVAESQMQSLIEGKCPRRRNQNQTSVGPIYGRCFVGDELERRLARGFTTVAQERHGLIRPVDRHPALYKSSVAAKVVHMVAGIDGGDSALPKACLSPVEQGRHRLRGVGATNYNQVGIGHLDQQRVGRPRERMRDHESAVPDLSDSEIGADVHTWPGLWRNSWILPWARTCTSEHHRNENQRCGPASIPGFGRDSHLHPSDGARIVARLA